MLSCIKITTIRFLAASPDGIIERKCCRKRLLEIKCPFKLKNNVPQEFMCEDQAFVLVDGEYKIKQELSSPFYVKMLGRMAVCSSLYCDFVLYTQKGLYVERIVLIMKVDFRKLHIWNDSKTIPRF